MAVERIVPDTNAWRESFENHSERYRSFRHLYPGRKVLDAACGVGYGSFYIRTQGAAEVTGLDIDHGALEYARTHYKDEKLEFMRGDCTKLPFQDNSFDVIVSFETLEHISNAGAVVAEFARCLKPGGTLLASTPNRLTFSMNEAVKEENPFHVNEMTIAEFRALIGCHLTVASVWHQSMTLAHVLAAHVEALDLALDRSLVVKLENFVRGLLGKQPISVARTRQTLRDVINCTPEPLLPLPPEAVMPADKLSVFVIQGIKPQM